MPALFMAASSRPWVRRIWECREEISDGRVRSARMKEPEKPFASMALTTCTCHSSVLMVCPKVLMGTREIGRREREGEGGEREGNKSTRSPFSVFRPEIITVQD